VSEAEKIKVKSGFIGTPHEDKVAYSDVSEVHGPDGVFVYGKDEFEVAVTDDVRTAIRQGRLVVCGQEADAAEEVSADLAESQVVTLDAINPDAATADAGLMTSADKSETPDAPPAPAEDAFSALADNDKNDDKGSERARRTAAKSR
jgi:hypothetical protein